MGLFQLFITELSLPGWLTVDDIEKLEMNLVGVVVVIIGVNFLSVIINPGDIDLLNYGVGYALPIIGLSLFIFVRSRNQIKDTASAEGDDDFTSECRIRRLSVSPQVFTNKQQLCTTKPQGLAGVFEIDL